MTLGVRFKIGAYIFQFHNFATFRRLEIFLVNFMIRFVDFSLCNLG